MTQEETRYVQLHPACGKPAWRWRKRPVPGETVKAADVERLDGSQPRFGGPPTCSSCGEGLEADVLNDAWLRVEGPDGSLSPVQTYGGVRYG